MRLDMRDKSQCSTKMKSTEISGSERLSTKCRSENKNSKMIKTGKLRRNNLCQKILSSPSYSILVRKIRQVINKIISHKKRSLSFQLRSIKFLENPKLREATILWACFSFRLNRKFLRLICRASASVCFRTYIKLSNLKCCEESRTPSTLCSKIRKISVAQRCKKQQWKL